MQVFLLLNQDLSEEKMINTLNSPPSTVPSRPTPVQMMLSIDTLNCKRFMWKKEGNAAKRTVPSLRLPLQCSRTPGLSMVTASSGPQDEDEVDSMKLQESRFSHMQLEELGLKVSNGAPSSTGKSARHGAHNQLLWGKAHKEG